MPTEGRLVEAYRQLIGMHPTTDLQWPLSAAATSLRKAREHAGDRKLVCKTIWKVRLGILPIECKGSEMTTADVPSAEAQEWCRVPVFLLLQTYPHSDRPRSLVWVQINANDLGTRLYYCKRVHICSFPLALMHLLNAISIFAYSPLLANMYSWTASELFDDLCHVYISLAQLQLLC